jgi:PleD family two-component response regulator
MLDGGSSMRGTILIVHDDLGVRLGLAEFLATKGYRVLAASTGQEALGILEEDLPRLLVIGVGMPLLSGWKLIEALAHYPDLSRIPRLLVYPGETAATLGGRALTMLESTEDRDGEHTPVPAGSIAARTATGRA